MRGHPAIPDPTTLPPEVQAGLARLLRTVAQMIRDSENKDQPDAKPAAEEAA